MDGLNSNQFQMSHKQLVFLTCLELEALFISYVISTSKFQYHLGNESFLLPKKKEKKKGKKTLFGKNFVLYSLVSIYDLHG
jgi:hypothetical protein